MQRSSILIVTAVLIAAAFALPSFAGTPDHVSTSTISLQNPSKIEIPWCERWGKATSDPNASSVLIKCSEDKVTGIKTLVFNNSIKQNKTLPPGSKFVVSTANDKLAVSAGACIAASKAACKAGDAKDFAAASLAYDKDEKAYIIQKDVKANTLPNITIIQFGKDDVLEDGAMIKFGAATETWVYTITGDTGTGYYIWETEPKLWHPANVTAANNFGGSGSPPDVAPNYVGASLYFNTSHAAAETIVMETEFVSTPPNYVQYTTCVLMMMHTPIIQQQWDFSGTGGDNIRMCFYDNSVTTLYMATQNGAETSKSTTVDSTVSHVYKFRRNDTAVAFFVDGVQVAEITTNLPDGTMYAGMGQGNARTAVSPRGYWSNVSVDDGSSPPPIATYAILFKDLAASFPATYEPTTGISLSGKINASDGTATVLFDVDGTENFTGTNTTYSGNLTWTDWTASLPPFAAGTHNFTIFANDMSGNSNTSESFEFNISKASPGLSLTSSAGWSIGEGATTTLSCSGTSVGLYLDFLPISNPYLYTAAGTIHDVTCNVTDTVNYTAASDSQTLTVTSAGLILAAKDEASSAPLTFNLTIANSTSSLTIDNIPSLFISFNNASLPMGNLTLTFSASGYIPRNYYLSTTPGTNQSLTAYLLTTASGSYVRFHTLTGTSVAIPGVLVTANRSIGGFSTTVQQQYSDASGISLMFLNPLITYTITATKTGYAPQTLSIAPSLTDYNIYMTAGTNVTGGNLTGVWFDVRWSLTPNNGTFLTPVVQPFNFTAISLTCSLQAYGMNITLNGTQVFSGTGNATCGGFIPATINLTAFNNTVLRVTFWWNHTAYGYYSRSIDYYIWPSYGSGTLWDNLLNVRLNSCGGPMTVVVAGVVWCIPLAMITLLVMLLVGAGAGFAYGSGGAALGSAGVMWLLTMVQWFPWQIALLLSMALFGMVVLRRV